MSETRSAKRNMQSALTSAFCILHFAFLIAAPSVIAQNTPQPAPPPEAGHDLSRVEPAPADGAIATPLPEAQKRRMKKYDIPELTGARQALGSQLIEGELPKPLVDYIAENSPVFQRISIFEGGLVVVKMAGAGGTIRKKVIIPADALKKYVDAASGAALALVNSRSLGRPRDGRRAILRAYAADGSVVERQFDPSSVLPKKLDDQISPLQDLLRALSEDRTVSNSVAGYEPKVGDHLAGDDRKVWRVARIIAESGIVELRCVGEPLTMYVGVKDLYNYFIGSTAPPEQ